MEVWTGLKFVLNHHFLENLFLKFYNVFFSKRTALIDTYQKNIETGVGKVENIWGKGINKLRGRKP